MFNDQLLLPEWRTPEMRAIRDGVAAGLDLVSEDVRVVVLSADLAESTRAKEFAEVHPERFFEVGVAEQNMAGIAAGLSFTGFVPFMASYATFSPGRNWEQIRVSVALSKANVKIIGSHAGVTVGVNGPSHMGTEDIALMRVLPGMSVIVPADYNECKAAIMAAKEQVGPVYIRTVRPESAVFTKELPFEIGKVKVYRSVPKNRGRYQTITVAACGLEVYKVLVVAESLAREGIECEVLNVSTIKPLDEQTIYQSVSKTRKLLTVEDHQRMGGMGSAILEFVSRECMVPTLMLGIKDQFGVSGESDEVVKLMGLSQEDIAEEIRRFVVA